jgi:uncharacterized membrane protein YGL010W
MNYEVYQQNSINKCIHTICIPLILITSFNIFYKITTPFSNMRYIELYCLIISCYYLLNYSFFIWFIMSIYNTILLTMSEMWIYYRHDYYCESLQLFIISVFLKSLGHYIEGYGPCFWEQIITIFTQAPLYSLNNIFRIL